MFQKKRVSRVNACLDSSRALSRPPPPPPFILELVFHEGSKKEKKAMSRDQDADGHRNRTPEHTTGISSRPDRASPSPPP